MSGSRVLIVGGGIAGLTTAIALRRHGIDARAFEKAPVLTSGGAGIVLTINAMRVLEELGIAKAVRERGTAIRALNVTDERRRVLSRLDLAAIGRACGANAVAIHRADLHAILAAELPTGALQLGQEYARHEIGAAAVIAHFCNGTSVEGELLVGCDGLQSAVRRALLGPATLRYTGQTCWRGIALGDPEKLLRCDAGEFYELWGGGERFGGVALDTQRVYWFVTHTQAQGQQLPQSEYADRILDLLRDWHPSIRDCVRATPPDAILQHDLFDCEPSRAWGNDRVILLGDAIHPSTPNLGQGAGMAIESAAVLARALACCVDRSSALTAYRTQRQPRTAAITNESWSVGRLSSWSNPLARSTRDWVMRNLPASLTQARATKLLTFDIYGTELGARTRAHEPRRNPG
jgi:2-polyprenyl-6-methoxyphenol hydroxylase-like FAD-dependent oxidoreductase